MMTTADIWICMALLTWLPISVHPISYCDDGPKGLHHRDVFRYHVEQGLFSPSKEKETHEFKELILHAKPPWTRTSGFHLMTASKFLGEYKTIVTIKMHQTRD